MSSGRDCRARLEGKTLLLEHSRYDVFIARFQQWLQQYDNEKKLLATTLTSIEATLLKPVLAVMEQESPAKGELAELDYYVEHLKREHHLLTQAATNKIRAELSMRRPAIGAVLDHSTTAESVAAKLAEIAQSVSQVIQVWLEKELETFQRERINTALREAGLDPEKYANLNESELLDKLVGPILSQLKGVNKDYLTKLLVWGRSLKIPGLKGRWLKTLEVWAGRAAPVLQIVFSLAEVAMAARGEEQENERNRRQALQRSQWIEEICGELQVGLTQSVTEVVNLVTEEQLRPYESKRVELQRTASQLEIDRAAWIDLSARFNAVSF
ncbi:hypothetical protein CF70_034290 [Cupriavidus sp. SK-3]|uniref:hypothetical protein n=1 Tax=Cupriavidus sp. SK-3 TaxID=1470558 RepID=UPI000448F03F|nr:hypothetical protein [Cupriavidus sp. SK-3]KDP87784.1 hypothetical protein CF70_034290 [Cupriavidus sp. SK-3]